LSLAEGMWVEGTNKIRREGFETCIWDVVNAFNKEQLSVGQPPATCDEIIKGLAWAVHYVLTYLAEPDFGYADPDEDPDEEDLARIEKVDHADEDMFTGRFIEAMQGGLDALLRSNDNAS
jgi:hypothetical protein